LEGVIVATLVALVYGQRKKLLFWRTLDVLTPGIVVFMVFIGLAHLASGDAFGVESDLLWAIELWGAQRHPTQIYEIFTALVILYLVLRLNVNPRFDGFLFLAYSVMAAISRYLVEAFRGDSLITLGSLRSAQVLSLLLLVGALTVLHLRARRALVGEQST
jgi:phosphatidylglycerol:prolipoprotein diacylglycerol transferase